MFDNTIQELKGTSWDVKSRPLHLQVTFYLMLPKKDPLQPLSAL